MRQRVRIESARAGNSIPRWLLDGVGPGYSRTRSAPDLVRASGSYRSIVELRHDLWPLHEGQDPVAKERVAVEGITCADGDVGSPTVTMNVGGPFTGNAVQTFDLRPLSAQESFVSVVFGRRASLR